jgi:ribonucleoside-diphosphate reductase alpha subunit
MNAGIRDSNYLISCYLQVLKSDSIDGIYTTLHRTAMMQKGAGGVSTSIHEIRGYGSVIRSSGSISKGAGGALKVFEDTSKYVDQGGRRPGSNVFYKEPWHVEWPVSIDYSNKQASGNISSLFYATWMCGLFMDEVYEHTNRLNGKWYLMCPMFYPNLHKVHGEEFNKLYLSYVEQARQSGKIKQCPSILKDKTKFMEAYYDRRDDEILETDLKDLWVYFILNQTSGSAYYVLNKDLINKCNPIKNVGPILQSNLCAEVTLPTNPEETATCVLASIKVSEFVRGGSYDFEALGRCVRLVCENLNRVIETTGYPTEETRNFSLRRRSIGIGKQDLTAVFLKMGYSYFDARATLLGQQIQECIYYNALVRSMELSKVSGPFEGFIGSDYEKGILQFDYYDGHHTTLYSDETWNSLKEDIKRFGLRNCTLTCNMPTASTSTIMNSNFDAFYPIIFNVTSIQSDIGRDTKFNNYLIDDLDKLGLWNETMKKTLLSCNGLIGNLTNIPEEIKVKHMSVYESGMRPYMDHVAISQRFNDMSNSMDLLPKKIDIKTIYSTYGHAYKCEGHGLKTMCYYLYSAPAFDALKVSSMTEAKPNTQMVSPTVSQTTPSEEEGPVCRMEAGCMMCSS